MQVPLFPLTPQQIPNLDLIAALVQESVEITKLKETSHATF